MENAAKREQPGEKREFGGIVGFFRRRGPEIFLAILLLYVILLGIGVFAEVFKVQSILDWWIWRAPGS
jgi:hypothetical protein